MKTTAQSPQSKSGSTKRRRWLQVSLRTICLGFLLVALLSVYLGRPSVGYYHDRKVADRIEALGGTCEWMAFPPSFGSAPDRLLTRMGVKAVIDRTLGIVHARLVRVEVRSGQVSMEDVELLSTCEELRDLVLINVGLTNEMVAVIGLSDSIESLDIRRNSSVTDAAVDGLSGIPALVRRSQETS